MPKKTPSEQEILRIIKDSQEEGILQSELWKKVNANSRDGSRAVLKLEKKGLIERRRELHEGRWTYRIIAKHRFATVDSIADIPCAFCDLEGRCEPEAEISPINCKKLTKWLIEASKDKRGA